jgi:hypothetical protein
VNINLFDEKLILQQDKCSLPPSIRVINSAEKSAKEIELITLQMKKSGDQYDDC